MGNVVPVVPARDRGLTHSLVSMLSVEEKKTKKKRQTQLANIKPGSAKLGLRVRACTWVLPPG